MRIAIDAREAFSDRRAGKGQWTAGFVRELRTRGFPCIVLTSATQHVSNSVSFPASIRCHLAAASYAKANADLYVSPTSFIVPALLSRGVPCIPIIHDLIAFRGEPHNAKATIIERLLLSRVIKSAAHICTISEATKRDLLERYPSLAKEKVTTIYAGPMRESVPLAKPDGKTILCVGTLCPRKNQDRLIRAFASLPEPMRSQYRLVLAGARGWHDAEIVRLASNTKGVEWLDYVSDAEYGDLLSSATVFAYPSLYEGFGMQVLDALQRGIPVLTSNRGSLREVVGDAGVMVDPASERSIAAGLTAMLQDAQMRQKCANDGPKQAKIFSWKQTVDLFLEAVEKALY